MMNMPIIDLKPMLNKRRCPSFSFYPMKLRECLYSFNQLAQKEYVIFGCSCKVTEVFTLKVCKEIFVIFYCGC